MGDNRPVVIGNRPDGEREGVGTEDDTVASVETDVTVPATGASVTPVGAYRPLTPSEGGRVRPQLVPADMPWLAAEAYDIGEEVARGGMGRVVRAVDRRLGRVVALKQLVGDSASLRVRFVREAQITALLQHPSIVPIYEAGRWPGGGLAYAMKLVSGQSLDQAIAARSTLAERLSLLDRVVDVVDAVAYAHGQRVIHRDIKPSNIILGDFGETILIDWGIAKVLDERERDIVPESELDSGLDDDDQALTRMGTVIGTPAYMAPEQAAGELVDDRVDVYALGAMLYHLLTGRPPYGAPGTGSVLYKVLAGPPEPPDTIEPHIPAELVAIVARAMQRRAEDRYGAAELAEELRRFSSGNLVAAYQYSGRERLVRWIRGHRAAVTAFVVLAAALAVTLAGLVAVSRARREAQVERARAESAAGRSRALLASQLEEQGRQLFLAGDPLRAALYLGGAVEEGATGSGLAFLLGESRRMLSGEERSLTGHRDIVVDLAFSPDGKTIATASRDGSARLFDAATGSERALLGPPHRGSVWTVEFSADGTRLLTGAEDGVARLWDARSGRFEGAFAGSAPRFDRRGTRLLTTRPDGTVSIWQTASGELIAELPHTAAVSDADFDASGELVVTATRDGHAQIWELASRRIRHRFPGETGRLPLARLSPDGARLVTAGEQARLWDARTGSPISTMIGHEQPILQARFSPDGATLVTASADGTVRMWQAASGKPLRLLRGHASAVIDVRFDRAGRRLVTASADETARIWDPGSGIPLATLAGHTNTVRAALFSPDGSEVATAGYDGVVKLWTAEPQVVLVDARDIEPVAFDQRGERLATAAADGTLAIWDLGRRQVVGTLALPPGRDPVLISPSWKHLVADRGPDLEVWPVPPGGGQPITLPGAALGRIGAAAFGPADGVLAAAGSQERVARVWDLAAARPLAALEGHESFISDVAVSADGSRIATASFDGTARIWRATGGAALHVLRGHRGSVTDVEFSADGRSLSSAGNDGRAVLWDVASGAQRITLDGYKGNLYAARIHPGGEFVLGSGSDGMVLWDAVEGKILARSWPAQWVAFSPAGQRFALWAPGSPVQLRPFTLETGGRRELGAWLACAPMRLEASRLVANGARKCPPARTVQSD